MTTTQENSRTGARRPGRGKNIKTPKKPVTRKVQLITLLGRKAGCDIPTISERFGWQQHTTRSALSGFANPDLI